MSGLSVTTPVPARLTWRYESEMPRVLALYERAKSAQWNATTDVDWSIPVPFGEPLPDDSAFAMASFEASPLAARGRPMWDTFRWELQSWMVSQFLHGEQGALVVAARLVEVVPDLDSKYYAASQAADEARHVEAFSRYLREKVPDPYPINPALAELLEDLLSDARWDITALGMQIIVEALAMAAFRLANSTFHDRLICDITRLVARDEARHVSFGVLSLEGIYAEMTSAERADREEMVLESASLMRRRFLLEDVWERIEVDREEGVDFAAHNELMIKYRQAIFARVVTALANIGLLTPRVRSGLERLDLIGFADRSIRLPRA
ncbi:ferritin-like domain-containing protein [Micromonospora sp. WMMC241]|uniref:ferritin-like domain-containing protein n=1 Tax=Micromonospora sp. WMMC241 TaxID=3015159 RepID=UPI0022B6CE25|nr:ferritin-like domain-containing protein [Micromonospora sp. WMMC241]MCZ7437581.1 ferritin-like domain-containing protein [Micromonospora sp. WMMC241]